MEKYKYNLETSTEKDFRDDFYYLCQEDNSLEIKKAFIQNSIRSKMTPEVLSYAFMGAARTNQLNNAITLINLIKKYEEIKLEEIDFTASINMSLKKDFIVFFDTLIKLSNCFENKLSSFMNRDDNVIVFNDMSGSIMNNSIIEDKYKKFSKPSLDFFKNNTEKLNELLSQKININYIKDMLQLAVEEKNILPIIAFVKSKYLGEILKDKDFMNFISNEDHKEIKKELQNLMNNALLEKKLEDKLIKKESKEKLNKI